ncbi:hypothetical protein V1517DRAFT_324404 [Lipomyces orientalis]|uniref:Uncharacterized protein n=1 Tax=Lipomyces orientalis TaxID=1233043 RepID=A0ACC3TMM5_9ASCO
MVILPALRCCRVEVRAVFAPTLIPSSLRIRVQVRTPTQTRMSSTVTLNSTRTMQHSSSRRNPSLYRLALVRSASTDSQVSAGQKKTLQPSSPGAENKGGVYYEDIDQKFAELQNLPREQRMRMTPDRDEIVEEGHDSISDRVVPKWPLSKESFPTLPLHLIRTPRVGPNLSFRELIIMLETSKESEVLLYQAEPHRLYFIVLYSLAFVFAVYGLIFIDWALRESYDIYINNYDDLPPVHNLVWLGIRSLVSLAIFAIPAVAAYAFIMMPTRIIRRMHYLPARRSSEAHVKFVVHPLIPRTASPVITVPVSQLDRGKNPGKTKVWTGDGLYGTASRSQFMVFLFEKGKRIPWIVDRQGWFWGDGRVWDILFGKESIEEAERGLSGDDLIKIEQRKQKQEQKAIKAKRQPRGFKELPKK